MTNNRSQEAIDVFHTIDKPNEVILILILNACLRLKTPQALQLIKTIDINMPESYRNHPRLNVSLLDALIKSGQSNRAEQIFERSQKSVIAYGTMINGFNLIGQPEKALNLFNQMINDSIKPNSVVYLCVIKTLAEFGDLSLSTMIVDQMPDIHFHDESIRNALIDMWVRI